MCIKVQEYSLEISQGSFYCTTQC